MVLSLLDDDVRRESLFHDRPFMLLLVLALATAPSPSPGAPAELTVPVLAGRVSVTAEFADTSSEYMYETLLRVRHGAECFEATTYLLGPRNVREAIEELHRTIGWKGQYLFVRTSCGSGNNWKCTGEIVFTVRNGHLLPLATLVARRDSAGTSFRDGDFHDIDADWEINDLTSHAGAPYFGVVLRDMKGRMKADMARTWAQNVPMYQRNDSLWRSMRDSLPSWNVSMIRTSALFTNAVLATYCGRTRERTVTLAEARRSLDPRVYDGIAAAVKEIVPGALPKRSQPRVRACGTSTEASP